MRTVEDILFEIMQREAYFFKKMFIEDPLFLELEDVFNTCNEHPFGSVVLGIHEGEVNNFLNKLQMAMNHLWTIQQRLDDEGFELNELRELYSRGSNLIASFTKYGNKIIYPTRFRNNRIGGIS